VGLLLLFFDGIGIGRDDPDDNPFAADGIRRLAPLAGRPAAGAAFRPLDSTLGVPGLPQSATGQTTIYTGVNAAALIGRHQLGLPGPSLWPLLAAESLFLKLVRAGRRPTFANAYPREHLEARRPRWGATTRMVLASGVPFRSLEEDEPADRALPHDYTGAWPRRHGYRCRERDAERAARVLAGLLDDHDVVLYEYFLTDLAGHRGTREQRFAQARRAEEMVDAALAVADTSRHAVAVVSDHGNLEESGHDRHTRNPVPLLAWGRGAEDLARRARRLQDLAPAIAGDALRPGEARAPEPGP
jgi:hypothetical protein